MTIQRMLFGGIGSRADIIEYNIYGTVLLWLRMLDYLSGTEVTSQYVRMTYEIIADLQTFMFMLGLFVVGNAYVLQSLYPSNLVEAWDPQLESADSSEFWKRIPTTEERLQVRLHYNY